MSRKFSDMTLEELWGLFPIILTEHQEAWEHWYDQEKAVLESILPADRTVRISHVGSTVIPGIWAKPIVDILVEVTTETDMEQMAKLLCGVGWIRMSNSNIRMSFNKGYTPQGFAERVFHLHLRYEGDHDELYFRDYLREHPEAAKDYEKLKLRLWKKYEHDRDGYTDAKSDFVKRCTEKARKKYEGRYK